MKDIGDRIEETYQKFVEQENKDPRRSANDFLQRYFFSGRACLHWLGRC